jgi:hypothetical protein
MTARRDDRFDAVVCQALKERIGIVSLVCMQRRMAFFSGAPAAC